MEYNDNLGIQYPLLLNFVYHVGAYRQILNVLQLLPGDRSFWVYTSDAHIQMAITSWCKVFGSSREDAHYSKLYDQAEADFDEYLFAKVPCSACEWKDYRHEMMRFRNKYIAHSETTIIDFPVPYLDMALKAVCLYDCWTRVVLAPVWNENPVFEERNVEFNNTIRDTLKSIIK